jgi:hypothetical protein
MIRNIIITVSCALVFIACKKTEIAVPPTLAQFLAPTSTASYFVANTPNSVYKIPVGFTNVSNVERTINYTVSSPTGAAVGTQYNIQSSGTIKIPAGQTVDSIQVRGLFSGYPGNRRDTLVFKLTGGDGEPASWNNTFRLVMQRYCDVNLQSFTGVYQAQNYNSTTGAVSGNPYTVTMTPGTTTGTSGKVTVTGLLGIANPVELTLNWGNPANFTVSIVDQNWFVDATHGQARVRSVGSTNTFSSCDNSFSLRYEPYVAAGSYGTYVTVLTK